MAAFQINQKKRHIAKQPWIVLMVLALFSVVVVVAGLRYWYANSLDPVSSSNKTQYFTVEQGAGVHEVAVNLKEANLIRSSRAFETYVRSKELHDQLQAGTYSLSPSLSVQEIVKKMVSGDVAKNLLTILPGKNLKQIQEAFAKQGYSQAEIDKAFDPVQYSGHPALASLPAGASLEGYLYPDSFQKLADTPAEVIVKESLDEMQEHLSPNIVNGFKAQGLDIHQGIVLASVVEREVPLAADKPIVAQIFLSRLRQGIKLESDATTEAYNTYTNPGLPPQPISSVTESSLIAVAQPASTDYLFFVSGDDNTTHFSKTKAEHDAAVEKYCKIKCR